MDAARKVETLDSIIDNERSSIKWSIILAVGTFTIGLAASTVLLFLSFQRAEESAASSSQKSALEGMMSYVSAIPTLFGALLSAFPVKDYFAKKNRITSCQFLLLGFQSPPVPDEIEKRFWTLVDKSLG